MTEPGEPSARSNSELYGWDDRFRVAFEHAPIGMGLLGLDGRWLEVNAALCNLLEYSEQELLALTFDQLRLPGSERLDPNELTSSRPETRYRRADGSAVWVAVSTTLVRDDLRRPSYYVVQVEDISERKRAERDLRRLADQDALTGLLNRRGFLAGLRRELRRMQRAEERGAMLSLDLDNFKEINDSAGHAAGDLVLRGVAEVLRRRLRTTDVVGRLGGDEFAALLLDVGELQAREIAFELTQSLRGLAQASIGVVVVDGAGGKGAETILAEADRAMYEVKVLNRAATATS